ncbi:MAG: DNA recombination protein RmuC [Clostridia bacterium]
MLNEILICVAIAIGLANIVLVILLSQKVKTQDKTIEIMSETTSQISDNLSSEMNRQIEGLEKGLNQLSQTILQSQLSQSNFQKERLDNLEKQIVTSLKNVDEKTENLRSNIDANLRMVSEQTFGQLDKMRVSFESNIRLTSEQNQLQLEKVRTVVEQNIKQLNSETKEQLEQMRSVIEQNVRHMSTENKEQLEQTRDVVEQNVRRMSNENKEQLEQMRNVVDEKLSQTLETRLNQSFEIINKSLSQVNQGLGDMNTLAKDVGGLKNVLQNVKIRGTWAEWQLDNLLSEFLNGEQYIKNCPINPQTQERVDFAIILPGKEDRVLLPIDSKFPIEEYNRLITASQNSDTEAYEKAIKNLELRIKEEAKSINNKYILVPKTTDFAIMYLPVEGLYAEVVKKDGLCEMLQRQYRITVCGPSTLGAMLSSLQMGFKTLAIEKKSSEIHKMLLVFKSHFVKFTELLEKTQKKITEASNTIEDATKKTRTISRKLNSVEVGTFDEEQLILEANEDDV